MIPVAAYLRRLAGVSAGFPGVAQVQVCAGAAQVDVRAKPVGDLRQDNRVLVRVAGLIAAGGAGDVLREHLS